MKPFLYVRIYKALVKIDRRVVLCHLLAMAVGVFITTPTYLLFDRWPCVELHPELAEINPNPARPGGVVTTSWVGRPLRNCSGHVIPRVIDSAGRITESPPIPVVYRGLPADDRAVRHSRTFELPPDMAEGLAFYQPIIFRWSNFVQRWLWPMVEVPAPVQFRVEGQRKK